MSKKMSMMLRFAVLSLATCCIASPLATQTIPNFSDIAAVGPTTTFVGDAEVLTTEEDDEGRIQTQSIRMTRFEQKAPTFFVGGVGVDANSADVLVAFGGFSYGNNQLDLQISSIDPEAGSSDIRQLQIRYKRKFESNLPVGISASLAYADTEDSYQDIAALGQASFKPFGIIQPSIEAGLVRRDFDTGGDESEFVTKVKLDGNINRLVLNLIYELENDLNNDGIATFYATLPVLLSNPGRDVLLQPQFGWQEKGTFIFSFTGIF